MFDVTTGPTAQSLQLATEAPPHQVTLSQGWGSGFGQKPLYLKRREIFKSLLNEYFRYFLKPSVLFSYFWCQTSPLRPRSPDPGWFSEFRKSMVRLTPKVCTHIHAFTTSFVLDYVVGPELGASARKSMAVLTSSILCRKGDN